jgi:antibiotic biosynthesis monooxygenase (ABM) superfamily enzyme
LSGYPKNGSKVEPFIDKREQQVATSFSGWFTFGDAPGQVPPNWKQSMIVLLTLYPIVMLKQLLLNPLLLNPLWDSLSLQMAVAIFIGNALSVAATGFLLVPLAIRALDWWLVPGPKDYVDAEIAGTAITIGRYALSIAVFA